MFGARAAHVALLCWSFVGCTTVENEPVASPAAKLDETVFRCQIEPILARQCSYNACHGNAGSALRIYTPGKLRAVKPKDAEEATAVLSEAEHHANFLAASGFGFDTTVDDNWLLRKPLPASAGGFAHKGGAIFSGRDDTQFVAIRAWLSGTGACK